MTFIYIYMESLAILVCLIFFGTILIGPLALLLSILNFSSCVFWPIGVAGILITSWFLNLSIGWQAKILPLISLLASIFAICYKIF